MTVHKRILMVTAMGAVIAVVAVLWVGRNWIRASYYLYRMESADDQTVREAARKLAELESRRALPLMAERLWNAESTESESFWVACLRMYGAAGAKELISRYKVATAEDRERIIDWLSEFDDVATGAPSFIESVATQGLDGRAEAINALTRIPGKRDVAEKLLVKLLLGGLLRSGLSLPRGSTVSTH